MSFLPCLESNIWKAMTVVPASSTQPAFYVLCIIQQQQSCQPAHDATGSNFPTTAFSEAGVGILLKKNSRLKSDCTASLRGDQSSSSPVSLYLPPDSLTSCSKSHLARSLVGSRWRETSSSINSARVWSMHAREGPDDSVLRKRREEALNCDDCWARTLVH
jgi:hypothetical protein